MPALRHRLLLAVALAVVGCATPAPVAPSTSVPRREKVLDLQRLAAEVAKGAPPAKPIWGTLPAHLRRAIELRLATLATPKEKWAEAEKRREVSFSDEGIVSFAELIFLLEELAFGPPSDLRTEARATLATLYASAKAFAGYAAFASQLAARLGVQHREGDHEAFFRTFTQEGRGLHDAFFAEVLRDGAPKSAVSRVLFARAGLSDGEGDFETGLALRETAVSLQAPDRDDLLTLAEAYARVLDDGRGRTALAQADAAAPGRASPEGFARRRATVEKELSTARLLRERGEPKTAEDHLAVGEGWGALGAPRRAEASLREAMKAMPADARPRVALARLRVRRPTDDVHVMVREVTELLEPGRTGAHKTPELYELLLGVAGATLLEDVARAGADPAKTAGNTKAVLERLRTLSREHAAMAPSRAVVLSTLLDTAAAILATNGDLAVEVPKRLGELFPRAKALRAEHPSEPETRMLAVGVASFAAGEKEGLALLLDDAKGPRPPPDQSELVLVRALAAFDLAITSSDATDLDRASDLAKDDATLSPRLRAELSAVRGDVELAKVLRGAGSASTALEAYDAALRETTFTGRTRVEANRAWALARTAGPQAAASALVAAVQGAGKVDDAGHAQEALATFALAARQPADALSLTEQLLARDKESHFAHALRALALNDLGRKEEARAAAKTALALLGTARASRLPWGHTGTFGTASIDFRLGIGGDEPIYRLRFSAVRRHWFSFRKVTVEDLHALGNEPAKDEATPARKPNGGKR